jgi:glycosyltransferase involved in cell wall biosynthesis
MAEQTRSLTPELKDIAITPFGVDLEAYKTISPGAPTVKSKLVIGTVKTMRPKYGIDTLIRAYAILVNRLAAHENLSSPELELRLVGGGDQIPELKVLAEELGVSKSVNFVGRVPHIEVPNELAKLDIYVALSRMDSESFGVAIIEASAAGKPVVVSDAGGLSEVTVEGETGFVVPRDNPEEAAYALERLVGDAQLRHSMGIAGQQHVAKNYCWNVCIKKMLEVYE